MGTASKASAVRAVQPVDSTTESDGGIDLVTHNYNTVEDAGHGLIQQAGRSIRDSPRHNLEMQMSLHKRGLDWCDRGFHVDFHTSEQLPLRQGRFLGPGVSGGVYETVCKGVRLAWKTKYCSRGVRPEQMREVDILRRLDHRHVVRLMGTYTQGPLLGLLLAPVAVCDLKTFMEDIDTVRERLIMRDPCMIDNSKMMRRLDELCPDTDGGSDLHHEALSRLSSCFGCLVDVIAYLHEQHIRHKDIKPSNVLVSHRGVWLADFGISSDFSDQSSSQSEAIDRGTPKYFAPEIALFEKSGRPADIFSLGCMFLEMVALLTSVALCAFQELRPEQNGSYHANLKHKASWFALLKSDSIQLQHLMCEIDRMIDQDARSRPLAFQLYRHFAIIAEFGGSHSRPLHGPCCIQERLVDQIEHMTEDIEELRLEVTRRDTYVDDLLKARSPLRTQTPYEVPRPPMGSNWTGAIRTNISSKSPKLWRNH